MARSEAAVEKLLARLDPWLGTLQRLRPPGEWNLPRSATADPEGPCVVWFDGRNFFWQETDDDDDDEEDETAAAPADFARLCEALTLLGLVARGEYDVWRLLMLQIWPSSEGLRKWMKSTRTEFVIGLVASELRPAMVTGDSFTRLSNSITSTASASAQFVDILKYIETAMDVLWSEDSRIPARIELDPCAASSETTTRMFQIALDLVKLQQSTNLQEESGSSLQLKRPRFTVTNVDLATPIGVVIDKDGFQCLQEFIQQGMTVSHLPPLQMDPTDEEKPAFVQALRNLVCLDATDDADDKTLGVQHISINDEYSLPVLQALLTAAQNSSSVHTIDIDLNHADGEDEDEDEDEDDAELWLRDDGKTELWMWIAFTIFSRHADHNIDTLVLKAEKFQRADVEAVRRVLNAPNPYAVANARPGVLPGRFVPRQITTSRFMLERTGPEDDKPGVSFESKRPIAVRVLDTPDKGVFPWYQVLLPGHGNAWVHETNVQSKSEDNLQLANRQVTPLPAFKRIEITMSDESMESVAALLELVGQETRSLWYGEHPGNNGLEGWCARVLATCHKLEQLDISGAFIDNLNVFEASARAGHCRLRERIRVNRRPSAACPTVLRSTLRSEPRAHSTSTRASSRSDHRDRTTPGGDRSGGTNAEQKSPASEDTAHNPADDADPTTAFGL